MADPFEVRMRFTSQLQHLNASTTSATKAANFALRHSEFSDDLHSCILEQLERNNMNNRANILYFIPTLCDAAKIAANLAYVRMIERDILRIVDLVAPQDGSGAANVKVVRKVLSVLETRGFLQAQTCRELEEWVTGRDLGAGAPASPSLSVPMKDNTEVNSAVRSTPHSVSRETAGPQFTSGIRLDKRQIEQRIEEDRERHKRAREGIWAIPQESSSMNDDEEADRLWDRGSDVDEDDFVVAKEEMEERRKHLEYEEY